MDIKLGAQSENNVLITFIKHSKFMNIYEKEIYSNLILIIEHFTDGRAVGRACVRVVFPFSLA